MWVALNGAAGVSLGVEAVQDPAGGVAEAAGVPGVPGAGGGVGVGPSVGWVSRAWRMSWAVQPAVRKSRSSHRDVPTLGEKGCVVAEPVSEGVPVGGGPGRHVAAPSGGVAPLTDWARKVPVPGLEGDGR